MLEKKPIDLSMGECHAANELKVVTDSVGSATKFDYYQSGPRLDEILPNNITTTYGYDTLNRLVNITQTNSTGPVTPLATFTYKLDNAGNRTNITEVLKYTYRGSDYSQP